MTTDLRNGSIVKEIQKLTHELKEKSLRIEELEEEVKLLKAAKRELEEVSIPDTMMEAGVDSLTLMTGDIVTVKPFYYARVPQEPIPFYNWLRENGFGALIKEKIEIIPSEDEVKMLLEILNELKIYYEQGSTIHWKTLEAWYKECCESGVNLPEELFTHYRGRKATVKGKK